MNGSANEEFDNFNIFELAKNRECSTLLKMVMENFAIYNFPVDSQDEDSNTLLHLVIVHQDHLSVVQQLLGLSPDVNKSNNMNENPLYLACCKGNVKIVKLLLEKGADLHVRGPKYKSLLHVAVETQNLELCRLLILRGIDVNSQDQEGATPLHYAIELKLTKITFLLVHKADVNKQDYDGYTPLHVASKTSVEQVKFLLRNKASPDTKTFNGDLALHLAASSGNLEAVLVLLNGESRLNVLNNDNYTPAKLAEINGHENVRKILLRNCGKSGGGLPSKIPRNALGRKNATSRYSCFSLPKNRSTISV